MAQDSETAGLFVFNGTAVHAAQTHLAPPAAMQNYQGKHDVHSNVQNRTCQPLSIRPLQPIVNAQRVHRQVRPRGGQPRTRLVIQPLTSSAAGTTTVAYAVKSVLCQQPKKGVILFLATPVVPEDISSICLVSQGSPVVIKVVPQPTKATEDRYDDPLCEVGAHQLMMQRQSSPHVIKMLDCLQDQSFVYIVLPYLEGGDFYALIDSMGDKGLPETKAQSYLRQICQGLLHMKKANLAHHDVSLENICVDKKGIVQIIDMGMSLHCPEKPCSIAGKVTKASQGDNDQNHSELSTLIRLPCRGKPSYMPPGKFLLQNSSTPSLIITVIIMTFHSLYAPFAYTAEVVHEIPMDPYKADVWSVGVCLYR